MKKLKFFYILSILLSLNACHPSHEQFKNDASLADLKMPNNHLNFKEIKDYQNYKMIAAHYRTDKNEIRYILGNKKAFEAAKNKAPFPDGSKIVKIGWTVEKMPDFQTALEAKQLKRIEYMIKSRKEFSKNPGNWGYARFVKENGQFEPWQKGTQSCINCHNLVKKNDFIFTKFQTLQ